jgi:hypothetical protein
MMINPFSVDHKQRGAALIVSLIILLIVTIIAVTAVRMSNVNLRSALNEEFRVEAFQQAQSIVDALVSIPTNTPVSGNAGVKYCLPGDNTCPTNRQVITLPTDQFATDLASGKVTAQVERLFPPFSAPPLGYSARCFQSARFSAQGTLDRSEDGQGRTTIHEGIVLPVQTGAC